MSVRTNFTATAAALLLALWAVKGDAQAIAGPFAALAGNWSGGGTLAMSNGEQERMRCRASYAVGQGGENVRLNIRCASDSFNFDLASEVASRDGRLSGEWSEATRNATGIITGRVNGSQIQAQASGAGFSANLSLTTQGTAIGCDSSARNGRPKGCSHIYSALNSTRLVNLAKFCGSARTLWVAHNISPLPLYTGHWAGDVGEAAAPPKGWHAHSG